MPDELEGESNLYAGQDSGEDGVHQDLSITVGYHEDVGLLPVDVNGPAGTPRLHVRTHAKFWEKRVVWTATRAGGKPVAPHPAGLGGNDVYLRGTVGVPAAVPNAQYTGKVYSLSGEYWYSCAVPPGNLGDVNLPGARLPVDVESASANDIPATSFDRSLLNAGGNLRTS